MGVYHEGLVLIANKFASAEHKAFTDFSLGTQIASDLNLVRVTNGDRYQEQLVPTFEDKTASVKGQTGSYYFGTVYKEMPITINVAFDNLNEADFNKLKNTYRSTLGRGIPQPLILDDCPYKYYMVVFNGAVNFNYIPFDENGVTVYKGEATLSFVCYDGWAREIEKAWGYNSENRPIDQGNLDGKYFSQLYGRTLVGSYGITGNTILNDQNTLYSYINSSLCPTTYNGETYIHIPVWNLGDYDAFPFIIMKKSTGNFNVNKSITIVHHEEWNENKNLQKLIIKLSKSNNTINTICLDCSRDIAYGFNSSEENPQIQYLTIKHEKGGTINLKPRFGQQIQSGKAYDNKIRCLDNIGFSTNVFSTSDFIAINYNHLYI